MPARAAWLSLTLMLVCGLAQAQADSRSVATVAGELRLSHNGSTCRWTLGARELHRIDCDGAHLPELLGRFSQGLGRHDEVLVWQELPMGNACNGGPLHLMALRRDGTVQVAAPLDFCGGAAPQLQRQGTAVLITFPGGPRNRGSGRTATARWRFQDGVLSPG